jgi:aspartate/methionine/tyrosine aminotransferase
LKLNPLLLATAAPPIPEVKAWTARYRGAEPLIDLSQAVPGYPPPPEFLTRLAEAAGSLDAAAYGDIAGDGAFRARYAEHVAKLYGGAVSADEIAITPGCNQAFVVTMMALARAGDAVILPVPLYFNHKMALDMLGIEAVALSCRAESGFVPDAATAARLIGPRTRAIVLITPNNPTGAVYPPATIRAFASLCAERGIALVIDETYRDFRNGDGAPHDLIAATAWRQTLVQLYSFSKAYCIPGHRTGAIAADAGFIAELAKILDTVQICPPRTPQRALTWAIGALAEWRDGNREIIAGRATAFRSAFAGLAGWSIESIGAYFAYVRHAFPGRRSAEVAEWLAAERGVLCLPGSYFGDGQEDFLRVAIANVDAGAIAELPRRLADPAEKRAAAGGGKRW